MGEKRGAASSGTSWGRLEPEAQIKHLQERIDACERVNRRYNRIMAVALSANLLLQLLILVFRLYRL